MDWLSEMYNMDRFSNRKNFITFTFDQSAKRLFIFFKVHIMHTDSNGVFDVAQSNGLCISSFCNRIVVADF